MEFKVLQSDFSRALLVSGKSILSRANLPILSNVLIKAGKDTVEVMSTNLETATLIKIKAKTTSTGDITLNGKLLYEFVSQLPDEELNIEKLGEEVVVATKRYSGRFTTMPSEEFPAIPSIEKGVRLEARSNIFAKKINKVIFCAAQDEGRPILTGVLWEINKNRIRIIATDGYRLGYDEIMLDGQKNLPGMKINVPARALSEVAKIVSESGPSEEGGGEKGKIQKLNLLIAEDLNQMNFKLEDTIFTSRLIEGEYPNWQKIIPSDFSTKAKINRTEFIKLVKITAIFARESGNIVKLKLEPNGKGGKLSVVAASSQAGSSDVSCDIEIKGKGGEIAFNYRYLIEALSAINEEEVNFEMNESLNPGKLTGAGTKDDPCFHIIMPVRLQS